MKLKKSIKDKAKKIILHTGIISAAIGIAMSVPMKANAGMFNNKCDIFSSSQLITLQQAYYSGEKYDYGWTLAAMAWRESSAGVKPINWSDPSFGPFHALITTVSKRYGAVTPLDELELANRLVYDFDFAVEAAVSELDYWKEVHHGNWRKIWASYNGGWKGNQEYATDIAKKIRFLQNNKCI